MDFAVKAFTAGCLCVQGWIAWAYPEAMMLASVPTFGAMIMCEALLQKKAPAPEKQAAYTVEDTLFSTVAGLSQILVGAAVVDGAMSMAYTWAWEQLGSPDLISNHKTAWLALFIGSDFAYYWVHRWSHEYQFLWAGHSVHHSSTQYNLSTALRQSWWQGMYNWSIMLWCAVAPPIEAQRTRYLVTVYQFWVHTCHIDRCGVLEEFLMTPSHHRVHHDARVHKNFAGVLLWDRLFGTFMREPERPVCKFGSRFDPDLRDAVRQFDGWRRRPLNSLIRGPWLLHVDQSAQHCASRAND